MTTEPNTPALTAAAIDEWVRNLGGRDEAECMLRSALAEIERLQPLAAFGERCRFAGIVSESSLAEARSEIERLTKERDETRNDAENYKPLVTKALFEKEKAEGQLMVVRAERDEARSQRDALATEIERLRADRSIRDAEADGRRIVQLAASAPVPFDRRKFADRIRVIAGGLTYNDTPDEGTAKHLLYECADRIGRGHAAIVAEGIARKASAPVPTSRWVRIKRTSPSGKTLFICSICGRESPTPDKGCRTMGDPTEQFECSSYDAPLGDGLASAPVPSDDELRRLLADAEERNIGSSSVRLLRAIVQRLTGGAP